MTDDTPRFTDGYPSPPHELPVFRAAESASDIGRLLYDTLERLHREALAGSISDEAMNHAAMAMEHARAKPEVN